MEGACRPISTQGAKEAAARMTEQEIVAEFHAADALLEGHFILSSGLHSSRYLQCARVLMDPSRASRLASALARTLPLDIKSQISLVVSPAMGGILIGHEMGRSLGLEASFRIAAGQKVLLVEDVVTTGLSSREAMKSVAEAGGQVIAAAALVDRSNGLAELGVPFFPLIRIDVPTYEPGAVPPELAAIPAIKPGSRKAA
jgi:orotate phosphoribosyltransferase